MIAKVALIGGTLFFTAAAAMSGSQDVPTAAPAADAAAVKGVKHPPLAQRRFNALFGRLK